MKAKLVQINPNTVDADEWDHGTVHEVDPGSVVAGAFRGREPGAQTRGFSGSIWELVEA